MAALACCRRSARYAAGVEILVACPGRLLDHMGRGTAKLDGIDLLVIDEADRMLDMGFLPAVRRILGQLPRERQTMLFSATFAPELETLAAQTLQQPERVNVSLGAPPKTVAHALYPVSQHSENSAVAPVAARNRCSFDLDFHANQTSG